jgi:hypothetical protein
VKILETLGATSRIWQVFIADSSSTTGAGLTGLLFNTASLTAYYHRDTDTTATAITLVTMTVGTFTSSGFKEIDATNMPGWYQLCPPNAALASGAKSVALLLKGATNMAPLPIEVQLTAFDLTTATQSVTAATVSDKTGYSLTQAFPANFSSQSIDASGRVDVIKIAGTTQTARDVGASVLLSAGTGTGQLDFTSGVVKANLVQILATALTETAGQLAGGFKKFFNIATPASTMDALTLVATATTVTNRVTANTDQLAGQTVTAGAGVTFPSSVASPTNITAGTITTTTNLTNAPPDSAGVTTLLSRIPSAIFTGITQLSHWLGMLAGKQAANATALTEIKASGAGSGTYDPTTDSLEANRDNIGTAGAGLTVALTTAYDAAKTAAQPGNAMALVSDAVDATAVAASGAAEIAAAVASNAASTPIKVNVKAINDATLTGNGTVGTPWGPA